MSFSSTDGDWEGSLSVPLVEPKTPYSIHRTLPYAGLCDMGLIGTFGPYSGHMSELRRLQISGSAFHFADRRCFVQ